jgi:hypothetical protein
VTAVTEYPHFCISFSNIRRDSPLPKETESPAAYFSGGRQEPGRKLFSAKTTVGARTGKKFERDSDKTI